MSATHVANMHGILSGRVNSVVNMRVDLFDKNDVYSTIDQAVLVLHHTLYFIAVTSFD